MKTSAYFISAMVFTSVLWLSCSTSDPEPEPEFPAAVMEPVIFNFTGTWDSDCGKLSRSVMDSLHLYYPNTPVINVHMNNNAGGTADPFSNSQSESLAAFFNVFPDSSSIYHIPYSWFMSQAVVGGSNFSTDVYQDLSSSILWAKENQVPGMALDITPEVSGNQLNVKIRTKAVQYMPVELFLSVYITEDALIANQVDDEGITLGLHHDVFRQCLNEFNGDKIANSYNLGAENDFSYSTTLDPSWKNENMKVTVIIWYKDLVYGNLVHLGKRVDLIP